MDSPQLLYACITALIAVFVLLSILAITMRILIAVFPAKVVQGDAAMLAAVATAVSAKYPGMRVTKVEEER